MTPAFAWVGAVLRQRKKPLGDQMFLNISETIWSKRVQTFSLPFKEQTWETESAV